LFITSDSQKMMAGYNLDRFGNLSGPRKLWGGSCLLLFSTRLRRCKQGGAKKGQRGGGGQPRSKEMLFCGVIFRMYIISAKKKKKRKKRKGCQIERANTAKKKKRARGVERNMTPQSRILPMLRPCRQRGRTQTTKRRGGNGVI